MAQMEDELIHVNVTQQNDSYTCGLRVIRFFDETLRIRNTSLVLSKESFEKQLSESKQLRLYNEEILNLKSELMEHYLNVTFIIGILTKSLSMELIKIEDLGTKEEINNLVQTAITDINEDAEKFKKKESKQGKKKLKLSKKNTS